MNGGVLSRERHRVAAMEDTVRRNDVVLRPGIAYKFKLSAGSHFGMSTDIRFQVSILAPWRNKHCNAISDLIACKRQDVVVLRPLPYDSLSPNTLYRRIFSQHSNHITSLALTLSKCCCATGSSSCGLRGLRHLIPTETSFPPCVQIPR